MICEFCNRETNITHYTVCLKYQTRDIVDEIIDLVKGEEISWYIKLTYRKPCGYTAPTYNDYVNHKWLLSKGMDRIGIDLLKYIIKGIKDEREDSKAWVGVALYILHIYNLNSQHPLDPHQSIPGEEDMNERVAVLIDWGSEILHNEGPRLKEIDYDGYLFSFGKHLFFQLSERFYENVIEPDPLWGYWYCVIIRLLVLYKEGYRSGMILGAVESWVEDAIER